MEDTDITTSQALYIIYKLNIDPWLTPLIEYIQNGLCTDVYEFIQAFGIQMFGDPTDGYEGVNLEDVPGASRLMAESSEDGSETESIHEMEEEEDSEPPQQEEKQNSWSIIQWWRKEKEQ